MEMQAKIDAAVARLQGARIKRAYIDRDCVLQLELTYDRGDAEWRTEIYVNGYDELNVLEEED